MRIPVGDRLVAFLGYLPVASLIIAWKVKRDNLFVQFHARQGALLFGVWLLLTLVGIILLFFFQTGTLNAVVFGYLFLVLAMYVLMVLIGLIKVLAGERYRMPLIADLALRLNL
jgi:uncharacterized membrane protein